MGSSSSRLGSRPPRTRVNSSSANRSRLSSLICGGSSSRATYEMEDHPAEGLVKPSERCSQIHGVQNSRVESSYSASRRTEFTSPNTEIRAITDNSSGDGLRRFGTSNHGSTYLSECKELTSPLQVSADSGIDESSRNSGTTTSSLFKEQQSSDTVSVNVSANTDAVNGIDNSVHNVVSRTNSEVVHPSTSSYQGVGSTRSSLLPFVNYDGEVMAGNSLESGSTSVQLSSPPATFSPFGSEPMQEVLPSGLGFLVSNRERARADGGVLHVDVVSISSNILSNSNPDSSHREARRNSRRLFWDAFSRRGSRRHVDSPTILFSMDDSEELGSHDRWLLGFSGDFFDDGNGTDSGFPGSRIPYSSERRRHSRSEAWERLRGGLDENGRRNTFCPSGLHPDGACSCESLLMHEESTTRASISRIVMLAEALFEVLDEIHRQPVSLSLSMVSSPAPASVVDSFPLRTHSNIDKAKGGDDVAECYICLAEYEVGDKIRVLPCHHEYHMACVDKWLKEIHGVCPLCRGDVREGLTECSASNSEILSV
ncbi:43kDa postsynaptic protein [Parasponia andersonii]|uniref:43kDa postsynaptic protein n=1 Tax=Parasponia andersonii TaxID=3476 RepID=A0A2P5AHE1_PARAD|nr:43kDa postsynaptic protein [Parasponia andersonii]